MIDVGGRGRDEIVSWMAFGVAGGMGGAIRCCSLPRDEKPGVATVPHFPHRPPPLLPRFPFFSRFSPAHFHTRSTRCSTHIPPPFPFLLPLVWTLLLLVVAVVVVAAATTVATTCRWINWSRCASRKSAIILAPASWRVWQGLWTILVPHTLTTTTLIPFLWPCISNGEVP